MMKEIRTKELKVGDRFIDYRKKECKVLEIVPSETGKTVTLKLEVTAFGETEIMTRRKIANSKVDLIIEEVKPVKRFIIKQSTLDDMIADNKFLLRCADCGKIHTFNSYDDFKIDEDGFLLCSDCVVDDNQMVNYEFDIDWNKDGVLIFSGSGWRWNYDIGEREYLHKTFKSSEIIGFKQCQQDRLNMRG